MPRRKKPAEVLLNSNNEVEEKWVVEKIIDKKVRRGSLWYLLKWQNYPESANSWEPSRNLDCPELKEAFEADYAEKKRIKELSKLERKQGKSFPKSDDPVEDCPQSKSDEENLQSIKVRKRGRPRKKSKSPSPEKAKYGFDRGLQPEAIIGMSEVQGRKVFLLKWKGRDEPDVVLSEDANIRCPLLVIRFYEDRLHWIPFTGIENKP